MSNNPLPDAPAWRTLERHYDAIKNQHMKTFFTEDTKRFDSLHVACNGLLFDFSKHIINAQTQVHLCDLAAECGVPEKRRAMFAGDIINTTEKRAALHTALRSRAETPVEVDGENITAFVLRLQAQIKTVAEHIRNNPQITDVITIGIGGSDLGPRMVCKALNGAHSGPALHFINNIDGQTIDSLLTGLDPQHTALLIASKTFTTLETMQNARYARDWLRAALEPDEMGERLFAMSSAVDKATEFGIKEAHILPMRDWIGGRFSVWSSIGLPIAIAFGFDMFEEFLSGAAQADRHFKDAPLEHNIPVLMALLGVWYRNFFGFSGHALLPYADSLDLLPSYMQQLDMESNGKNAGLLKTAPIVFGGAGTCAQHAFMQALHQSEEIVPCDFIIIAKNPHANPAFQNALNANALAQAQALMLGRDNAQEPHRHFPGNRPSSTFVLPTLNAYYLGMLMAFYEHKIFTQGVLWGINSFDQYGVELGKTLAKDIIHDLEAGAPGNAHDSSTRGLIHAIVEQNKQG